MQEILENILTAILDKMHSGNCNISEAQFERAIKALRPYTLYDPYVTAYKAYTYLGICPKTFKTLIDKGEIPQGVKESGYSTLRWLKTDILEYSKKSGKINKHGFTLD